MAEKRSICKCASTPEANYFTSKGQSHVHCPCDRCEDRAVYPMVAWRHMQKRVKYMRRIFPVTPGTVVVPYYPCVNDMVYVRGDDEDTIWRARVLAFSNRRCSITGRFFKKRDDDNLWVPEGTRNQEIMFGSILGIVTGDWVIQFTTWRDA